MRGRVPVLYADATGQHGPAPTFGPKHNHVHAAVGRLRRSHCTIRRRVFPLSRSVGRKGTVVGAKERESGVGTRRGGRAALRAGRHTLCVLAAPMGSDETRTLSLSSNEA